MGPLSCAVLCFALVVINAACATAPKRTGPLGPDDLPIVLAHGLSGFRTFSGVSYFFRVPDDLKEQGHRVFATAVPPWGDVQTRSKLLARQVDSILRRTRAPKVHIIAHSMGGLDARHLVAVLGYGDRVASVTMVGTPHRGSPVADSWNTVATPPQRWLQDYSADFWVRSVGGVKEHNDTGKAVTDLSVTFSNAFNAAVKDDPRVRYYSFAGRTLGHDGKGVCDDGVWPNPPETDVVIPMLLATAAFLSGTDTAKPIANDGLVTVESAKWGVFMGCIPADHMKEVGQPMLVAGIPGRWNHRDFYVTWANKLVTGEARQYAPQ